MTGFAPWRGKWAEVLGEDFYPDQTQRTVEKIRRMFDVHGEGADAKLREIAEAPDQAYPRFVTACALLAYMGRGRPVPDWLSHTAACHLLEGDETAAAEERKDRERDLKHQIRWAAVSILMYGPHRRRAQALARLDELGVVPTWNDEQVYEVVSELLSNHLGYGTPEAVRKSYKRVAAEYRDDHGDPKLLAARMVEERW